MILYLTQYNLCKYYNLFNCSSGSHVGSTVIKIHITQMSSRANCFEPHSSAVTETSRPYCTSATALQSLEFTMCKMLCFYLCKTKWVPDHPELNVILIRFWFGFDAKFLYKKAYKQFTDNYYGRLPPFVAEHTFCVSRELVRKSLFS